MLVGTAAADGVADPAALRIEEARLIGSPAARVIRIEAGRIAAIDPVAADTGEGGAGRRIDAAGGIVLPGFHDAHLHLLSGGESLTRLDLDGAGSVAEIAARLRAFAAERPGDAWLLGRGWTFDVLAEGTLPDRHVLDAIVADRPVLLESYDGHAMWANSRALERAGVGPGTPDPSDGKVVREGPSRMPTGLLLEGAMALVERAIPVPGRAERLRVLRAALVHCSRLGITSADAFEHDPQLFEQLAELERRGELPLRIRISLPLDGDLELYDSLRRRAASDRLSFGYLKGFVDGVIESKTAYLLAPYAGEAGEGSMRGQPRIAPAVLEAQVRAAHARGFPVALHAIGDAAVRLSLDTFERVQRADPRPELHHRIEHIEVIDAGDLPRFAALGVVASMQPFHANPFGDEPDAGVWSRNLGAERLPLSFPWRMLHLARAPLVFGSDWPVMSADPLQGLAVALTRRDARGLPAGGWNAHQTLDLEASLSAWAGLAVGGLPRGGGGRLRTGMPADLVVLAPGVDPARPESLWPGERVRYVLLGGEDVASSPGAPGAPAALASP